MIIKKMQKSGRKTPRFLLNSHAMPMNKRLVRGWDGKSVKWEVAKGGNYERDITSFIVVSVNVCHISKSTGL